MGIGAAVAGAVSRYGVSPEGSAASSPTAPRVAVRPTIREEALPGALQQRWLWEESPDVWQPFPLEVSRELQAAWNLGEAKLVYSAARGGSGDVYEVDLLQKTRKDWSSGTTCRVRFKDVKGVTHSPPLEEEDKPSAAAPRAPRGSDGRGASRGEWQWEAKPGHWIAFAPEVEGILNTARGLGKEKVVFSTGGKLYEADLDACAQTNLQTGYRRPMRLVPAMQFQWELKPGVWVDYEEEENDSLVAAKKQGLASLQYEARGFEYEIDLESMEQVNASANSTKARKLRIVGGEDEPCGRGPKDPRRPVPKASPAPGPAPGAAPGLKPGAARTRPSETARVASPAPGPSPSAKRTPSPQPVPRAEPASTAAGHAWRSGGGEPRAAGGAGKRPSAGPSGGAAGPAGADWSRLGKPSATGAKPQPGVPGGAPRGGAAAPESGFGTGRAKRTKRWGFGDRIPTAPPPGPGPRREATAPPAPGPAEPGPAEPGPAEPVLPEGVKLPESPPLAREKARELVVELAAVQELPPEERRKAYRAACLKWHPDKNPEDEELATEVFQFLQQLKHWICSG